MHPKLRLVSLELSGARRILRATTTWLIVTCASVAAIGYLLPAHDLLDGNGWHANIHDGGWFPLAALVLVIGATLALRNRRLGSGMLTGVLAIGGAIGALVPVVLVHFLEKMDTGIGEHVFAAGILGLLLSGAVTFFAEPILYIVERGSRIRELRARLPQQLPVARVV